MEFYKKQTLIIVSFCLSLFIGVGLFNYAIDPFLYFRKAKYPIDWHERVGGSLLPFEGVVKHYSYDSLLIGSSISLNFNLKDIHNLLGLKKPIKLTASGINIKEVLPLLSFAFKHQPVDTIAMDLALLRWGSSHKRSKYFFEYPYFIGSFVYLYNFRVFENAFFYFSTNYLKIKEKSFCKLDSWLQVYDFCNSVLNRYDFDFMFNHNNPYDYTLHNVKKSYLSALKNPNELVWDEEGTHKVTKQLEDFIQQHRDKHFILWTRTDSLLKYKVPSHTILINNLNIIHNALKTLLKYPNVEIHDLRTMPFTKEIERYKDIGHYDPIGSKEVLQAIASKKYLLNQNNIDAFNQKLIQMIENYQIPKEIQN
ncbi:hypothetical protein [Helicobacter acinonychis]|uniref:Uncharacterized protein n=1 Tax=Helicobacter acinonychis (strain Sheeba) TaxID=382638 RepID=Q17WK3_HELAH|nr:hypothetical protein [Helicobacter acinonychis]CAJ99973.1 conserved hypothetical protein [Helicobacter acinonychis str. Sheeba]STP04520.1 Uncharacterised protein [Helicobacter acinonychis]